MNKQEFVDNILIPTTKEIVNTFEHKNISYGGAPGKNVFHNFAESARRVLGEDTKENRFTVLLTLVDKHLVALANKGVTDLDFEERCVDIAVYMMLAIGIGTEGTEGAEIEHWSRGIVSDGR